MMTLNWAYGANLASVGMRAYLQHDPKANHVLGISLLIIQKPTCKLQKRFLGKATQTTHHLQPNRRDFQHTVTFPFKPPERRTNCIFTFSTHYNPTFFPQPPERRTNCIFTFSILYKLTQQRQYEQRL
jgi:hypothetical protein